MTQLRIALVGLGGYGNGYVDAVLDHADEIGVRLVGAVDPAPRSCRRLSELTDVVGTIDPTLGEFYERDTADLVVVSAPIQFHAPFTITALGHGSHVLCEKPVAAVVQDARAMAEAEAASSAGAAIGYQWSFSDAVHALRRDIAAGRFGEPLQLKTLVFWPRSTSYYGRSSWAGALAGSDGSWVLDSPVNNATAHYLHNELFVLGSDGGRPLSVEAELYRANDIESFDTAALRVETASGAEVLFYTSHAVPSNVHPVLHYRFTEADVYAEVPGHFYVRFADGTIADLGSPETTPLEKLRRAAADVRAGNPPACSIADATHQSLVVCGAHESNAITDFPSETVKRTPNDPPPGELIWVEGLQGALTQCFAQGILPSEHGGIAWAHAGREIPLTDYERFPSRPLPTPPRA